MATAEKNLEYGVAFRRRASQFGVVVWSPDGKSVAAAGGQDFLGAKGDGLVWVWRVGYSEPMHFEGH